MHLGVLKHYCADYPKSFLEVFIQGIIKIGEVVLPFFSFNVRPVEMESYGTGAHQMDCLSHRGAHNKPVYSKERVAVLWW